MHAESFLDASSVCIKIREHCGPQFGLRGCSIILPSSTVFCYAYISLCLLNRIQGVVACALMSYHDGGGCGIFQSATDVCIPNPQ